MQLDQMLKTAKLSTINAMGGGIAAALTLLLIVGVIRPVATRNEQASLQSKAAARDRQHLAVLQTSVHALQDTVKRAEVEATDHPVLICSVNTLNTHLAALGNLCAQCGLTCDELTPAETIISPRMQVVPLHLTGHGAFRNCAAFINKLEINCPDVRVKAFRLVGMPEKAEPVIAFEFELDWLAAPAGSAPQTSKVITADVK